MYSNGLFGIHNGGLCIAGFTQGTIRAVNGYYSRRYPLTIHNLAVLVTKCSEISLLSDKPLSTTKPRLYITSRLQLLCKSYALGVYGAVGPLTVTVPLMDAGRKNGAIAFLIG